MRHRSSPAFTIVELLIVIVIIAILAAITIVAFNGVQQRARASAVSAALNQASKKLELYSVDNGGYPAALADASITDSNDITYQYTAGTAPASTYCATATLGTTSYYISDTTKTPTAGGCPGHGQGGVAAITNLATNPSVETGLSGLSGYYSSPLVTDGAKAVSGTKSVKTTTNSTTLRQGIIWTGANPATPNAVYSCSVSVAGTSGYRVEVSGRANTSGGSYVGESFGGVIVNLSSSWQRIPLQFTVPSTTGVMFVQMRLVDAPASGVDMWMDSLICVSGSSAVNYADGNSPNWVWNGAANASTSTGPAL